MLPLALAKRRTARRAQEGGAVMFLVAMVLAVLGSVGIYALMAAATEIKTSGNERQNTQTHYLAQLAVLGAADFLTPPAQAQTYLVLAQNPAQAQNSTTASEIPTCMSLPNMPTGSAFSSSRSACYQFNYSTDFQNSWWGTAPLDTYGGSTPFALNTAPGGFGPSPATGFFLVEMTTISRDANVSGMQQGASQYCDVTITSYAYTQPGVTTFTGEGRESQRARVVLGPFSGAQSPCGT